MEEADRLDSVTGVQLPQQVLDVFLGCRLGDEEPFGNLPVSGSLRDEMQDLILPFRERCRQLHLGVNGLSLDTDAIG
jgi:hypothetical protein